MLLMLLLVVTVGRPETFKNKQPNNTFQTQNSSGKIQRVSEGKLTEKASCRFS